LEITEFKLNNFYFEGFIHKFLDCCYGIGRKYLFSGNDLTDIQYKYYGYFLNNNSEGYGIQLLENGTIYKGEFRDGKKTGFGKEKTENYKYKGFFLEDKFNGFGELSCVTNNDNKSINSKFILPKAQTNNSNIAKRKHLSIKDALKKEEKKVLDLLNLKMNRNI